MKIILDNGHGVETKGKRSPVWNNGSQLFEYEFNRKIVSLIYARLKNYGLNPKILVPEKTDISLVERVRRANDIYSKDRSAIGVSIHGNAFTGSPNKANGWECWTTPGVTESDLIAEYLYLEAKRLPFTLRTDKTDGDSDKESRFYIIHKTNCPFVLTESGFMDNYNDCKFMMSQSGRERIADIHVMGLVKYIVANLKYRRT